MLINMRTRKVFRDFWSNKARSLLVTITIMLGVLSVGGLTRLWTILDRNIAADYQVSNPSAATFYTSQPFDEPLVEEIRKLASVGEAEGRYVLRGQVQTAPQEWLRIEITTRADYDDLTLRKVWPHTGAWPPPRGEILLERSAGMLTNFAAGEPLTLRLENDTIKTLPLAGTVYDVSQTPSSFVYILYGYVSEQTMEQLGGPRAYNTLDITVAQHPMDEAHIERVVTQVSERLEENGLTILTKNVPTPSRYKMANLIEPLLFLLASLTGWAVILNVLLVNNIISALLLQHTPQIGTLKAIGTRNWQIVMLYLGLAVMFGMLAIMITIPFNIVWTRWLVVLLGQGMNTNITDFYVPWQVYLLEAATGVVVVTGLALIPVLRSTGITIREAIGQASAQAVQFGNTGFEKLLGLLQNLSSLVLYAFRNLFRRKVRLVLSLIALSAAGGIYMSIASVSASFTVTADDVSGYWQENIRILFYEPHRFQRLERLAFQIPGVDYVEARLAKTAFRLYPDDSKAVETVDIIGVNPASEFLRPQLLSGRWLTPADTNSAVINIDLLAMEPDIAVGDTIRFEVEGDETTWQVVGTVTSQLIGGQATEIPIAYVNYTHLANTTGDTNRANRILIRTQGQSQQVEAQVSVALQTYFRQHGFKIAEVLEHQQLRTLIANTFELLFFMLQAMGIIFGLVGGLGLMTMMSLNVLERTREMGIIRAIGGVQTQIGQIVIIEGVFAGVISWAIGVIVAYPLSMYLSHTLGVMLIRVPFTYTFSLTGCLEWLGIVVVLAIAASLLPAYNASNISVRQALAYE